MFVSRSCEFVYLAPPRTGSHSVSSVLRQTPFNAILYPPATISHNTLWHPWFDNYETLITVRHPYVRAVSLWRFTCYQAICQPITRLSYQWREFYKGKFLNIEGFFKSPKLQYLLNTFWRCSWHLERIPVEIQHVVHLETFESDLNKVDKFKGISFPKLNQGPDSTKPWHYFYEQCPNAIELVQKTWLDDFDDFGYEKDFDRCVNGEFFIQH